VKLADVRSLSRLNGATVAGHDAPEDPAYMLTNEPTRAIEPRATTTRRSTPPTDINECARFVPYLQSGILQNRQENKRFGLGSHLEGSPSWHQGFENIFTVFGAPSIVSTEELVPTPTFPGPDKSDEKWPINLNPLVNQPKTLISWEN